MKLIDLFAQLARQPGMRAKMNAKLDTLQLHRDVPLCDFCSSPDVVHDFYCTDFESHPEQLEDAILHVESLGDWAACAPCRDLILDDQWDALLDRVTFAHLSDFPREIQLEYRKAMALDYAKFRKHMTGHGPVRLQ